MRKYGQCGCMWALVVGDKNLWMTIPHQYNVHN